MNFALGPGDATRTNDPVTLRVLAIAEFDPAGVVLSHRDCLRDAGVDFRVALHRAYTPRQLTADWVYSMATPAGVRSVEHDIVMLNDFASSADVIVVCPGIGQPWADDGGTFAAQLEGFDPPGARYFNWTWNDVVQRCRRHIAFFHGSVHTWAHRSAYRLHYRLRSYELAASTLDYAQVMNATYLPPWTRLDLSAVLAPLRQDDEPLIAVHTPTNPAISSTQDFFTLCRELGIVSRFGFRIAHENVLKLKAGAHVGFDHLRGAFSVNTIENAALGLVPLFALFDDYANVAPEVVPPWREDLRFGGHGGALRNAADLRLWLMQLEQNPALTRELQQAARQWYLRCFSKEAVTKRLLAFYGGA